MYSLAVTDDFVILALSSRGVTESWAMSRKSRENCPS
jgi:hypothetical protein